MGPPESIAGGEGGKQTEIILPKYCKLTGLKGCISEKTVKMKIGGLDMAAAHEKVVSQLSFVFTCIQ